MLGREITMQRLVLAAAMALSLTAPSPSPSPVELANLYPRERAFVVHAEPVIALTHATVIDGTGALPQRDVTLVMRDGRIAALGPSRRIDIPNGATVIDATGKTLLPGFVMVHEHMFYPTGPGEYQPFPKSFSHLYLAGGETTVRTGGSMAPIEDLNIRDDIAAGRRIGPDIDVTGPYLDAGEIFAPKMMKLKDAADARRTVDYWAAEGVTSFKAYIGITREELRAAIAAAHAHGLKITGHLCSVTYAEAATLGIDNLEHGFAVATDFVEHKKLDDCPDDLEQAPTIAALDPSSDKVQTLFRTLIAHHVAVTSTQTVFESVVPGRPRPPQSALDLLIPELREAYRKDWEETVASPWGKLQGPLFAANMKLEKAFADAGGTLLAGTDPTGLGGVLPGFSGKREIEILIEEGFSIPQAIKIATLNGARYLGRDRDVGTLELGKRADVVVIDGDLTADVTAIERMPLVFKAGIGIDTAKIFAAFAGKVGLY